MTKQTDVNTVCTYSSDVCCTGNRPYKDIDGRNWWISTRQRDEYTASSKISTNEKIWPSKTNIYFSVDKKNELDVTFCILYFSSNSCSTCFGQPPCSHGTYQHEAITSCSRQLLMMGTWLPETCWATMLRTHPWTHYLPTGLDNLPTATAHTNTRL